MNSVIVLGMLMCMSLFMSLCILTVSNTLLMSSVTVIMCVGGFFRLKPVAIVLLMLSKVVSAEWFLL